MNFSGQFLAEKRSHLPLLLFNLSLLHNRCGLECVWEAYFSVFNIVLNIGVLKMHQ